VDSENILTCDFVNECVSAPVHKLVSNRLGLLRRFFGIPIPPAHRAQQTGTGICSAAPAQGGLQIGRFPSIYPARSSQGSRCSINSFFSLTYSL
jgi:hypothetical protein